MHVPLSGLFLVVLAIIGTPSFSNTQVVAGKPSPSTLEAPRSIEIVDAARTEKLRKERTSGIPIQFSKDPAVEREAQQRLRSFFHAAAELRSGPLRGAEATAGADALAAELLGDKALVDADSGKTLREFILNAPLPGLAGQEKRLSAYVKLVYDEGVNGVAKVPEIRGAQSAAEKLLAAALTEEPNLIEDPEATARLRAVAADEVEPYVISFQAGETIVRDGEIVTSDDMQALERLGLLPGFNLQKFGGLALYVGNVFLLLGLYLRRQRPDIYSSPRLMVLLGIIIAVTVLVARLVSPALSPHLVPLPAVGMLVTILFSPAVGLVGVLTTGFLVVAVTGSLEGVIVGIMGGLLSVYLVAKMQRRSSLSMSAVWLAAGVGYLAFTAALVAGEPFVGALEAGAWGLVGGAGSAILTLGLLPLLEHIFGITTDVRLAELANPNHPLLKDLMLKAPGTYSHSVMAANLAEAAAEAIGANPLLARAGAYYHDIGKMRRPLFFIENQPDQTDYHDKITPARSVSIISDHVSEGAEMARSHRLPPEIIRMIQEHHGRGLIRYFYHKAVAAEGEESVDESAFRYPGATPGTKEAALVMLADSIEAAARSIKQPTVAKFEKLIKQTIDNKVRDGQLDESDLTLSDLKAVSRTFAGVLGGIYHTRIEYPQYEPSLPEKVRAKEGAIGGHPH